MALTINPAVSRSQRRWMAHSVAFLIGVFLGGLASLLMVTALISLLRFAAPDAWVVFIILIVIAWAALHDLGLPLPLPYRQQQVPERFRETLPLPAVAMAFGFQLGVGFLTLFTFSAHLAMLLAVPFLESSAAMLGAIGLFAIGKTMVLGTTLGIGTLGEITPRFRWTPRKMRVLRLITASVSMGVAVLLARQI